MKPKTTNEKDLNPEDEAKAYNNAKYFTKGFVGGVVIGAAATITLIAGLAVMILWLGG